MAVRSRHTSVLKHRRWEAAFGQHATLSDVLAFMDTQWTSIQTHPPSDMRFSSREPQITLYFCMSLHKSARAAGIFGFFIPEYPVAEIDEVTQVLRSRGRTDIAYLESSKDEPIEVFFEFKKMKSGIGENRSRTLYCSDGMLRFVNAIYARDYDIGFMVGLVEHASDVAATIAGVRRAIQVPDMRDNKLKAIKAPNGQYIATTGQKFAFCSFETRHARDHCKQCDVAVGHFFLAHRP